MANEGSGGFWTTLPGILTGVAALIGAVTGLYIALNRDHPSSNKSVDPVVPVITEPPKPGKQPMGPLERGIGFDHNDINANGWLSVISPEACSDLCYENIECRAMTYVVSNKSCWLKYAVPGRSMNLDEVSAVRQEQKSP